MMIPEDLVSERLGAAPPAPDPRKPLVEVPSTAPALVLPRLQRQPALLQSAVGVPHPPGEPPLRPHLLALAERTSWRPVMTGLHDNPPPSLHLLDVISGQSQYPALLRHLLLLG